MGDSTFTANLMLVLNCCCTYKINIERRVKKDEKKMR